MKLRLGFVTNSSSTNHIVFWKGEKDDLRKILLKHVEFPNTFEAYEKTYHIDDSEILDAFTSMLNYALNKSEMRKELNIRLKHAKQWYKESKSNSFSLEYATENLAQIEELIKISKNKDWMISVDFGDNSGDFIGGALGCIMDYEGRNIDVDEEAIAYKTRQNR